MLLSEESLRERGKGILGFNIMISLQNLQLHFSVSEDQDHLHKYLLQSQILPFKQYHSHILTKYLAS